MTSFFTNLSFSVKNSNCFTWFAEKSLYWSFSEWRRLKPAESRANTYPYVIFIEMQRQNTSLPFQIFRHQLDTMEFSKKNSARFIARNWLISRSLMPGLQAELGSLWTLSFECAEIFSYRLNNANIYIFFSLCDSDLAFAESLALTVCTF